MVPIFNYVSSNYSRIFRIKDKNLCNYLKQCKESICEALLMSDHTYGCMKQLRNVF
jgi:hypothetical protein